MTKYYGKWAGGGDNPECVRIEGEIPAIIDMETWEGVRKRMNSNKKGNNKNRRDYLLSGLIRCEKCGASFHGMTKISGKGFKTPYYACSAKYNKKTCDAQNINGYELDTLVVAILKKELLDPEYIERTADRIMEIIDKAKEDKENKSNPIKKELVDVTTKANNLLNALMTGLDSEMAREKLKELENQKQALTASLDTLEQAAGTEVKREDLVKTLLRDAEAFMNEPEQTKKIVHKYCSCIKISDTTVEITGMSDVVSSKYSGRGSRTPDTTGMNRVLSPTELFRHEMQSE